MVAGVLQDLARIAKADAALATSGLAAAALTIARELDTPGHPLSSRAMAIKALQDALDRLRELTPPEAETDGLDDLTQRRAARLGGGSAPKA